MHVIKQMFLIAPAIEIDPSVMPTIKEWTDEQPKSIEVLKTIDVCINGSLATDFAVGALQTFYARLLVEEGITHKDNVPLAVWRNQLIH